MNSANPVNIKMIDHVVIRARSLERLVAFYCNVLGCRLERGPGSLGLAQLRAGESLIDVVEATGKLGLEGGALPDQSAPNMDHVCLRVEPWDTDTIEAHLTQHEVDFDPAATRYGATGSGPSVYLRDPEGNRVELKSR